MKTVSVSLFFIVLLFIFTPGFKPPEKLFVPPGTVKINDALYFDKTEISNLHWRGYVSWNEKFYGKNSTQYLNSLYDTLVWKTELIYGEPYINYYHSHPAYNDFPVVGISWEQAVEFCKWRTERVQEMMSANAYSKKILPVFFNYRLPTEAEWETVAKAGYSGKFEKQIEKKNYKPTQLRNVISDSIPPPGYNYPGNLNATITAPVISYFPNEYGIYNLFGNVAEMIAENGVAKGGSWRDRNKEVTLENRFPYESAAAWLGFRCVCEVKWTER